MARASERPFKGARSSREGVAAAERGRDEAGEA